MSLLTLVVLAAIFFGLWRRNFAAAWFCFFTLELIRSLAVDIAKLATGLAVG